MEDIYVASRSAGTQFASKQAKRSRVTSEEPLGDFIWPLQEEEFVITLQENDWNLASLQSYNQQDDSVSVQENQSKRSREDIGYTQKKKLQMTLKASMFLKSGLQ